ncbi:hypothetical protein K523DRAFT_164164 [Schizophyllum commune Tattone D]|nr:hypothetical protein K523DRAFT_164164 [Schizophyllum commune Tattone D]
MRRKLLTCSLTASLVIEGGLLYRAHHSVDDLSSIYSLDTRTLFWNRGTSLRQVFAQSRESSSSLRHTKRKRRALSSSSHLLDSRHHELETRSLKLSGADLFGSAMTLASSQWCRQPQAILCR